MGHDSDAGFCQTNPSETKTKVLTAHTQVQGELKRNLVLQKSKKRSPDQTAARKPSVHRLEIPRPTPLSTVTRCEIGNFCWSPLQDE